MRTFQKPSDKDQWLALIANGDPAAMQFLDAWGDYVRAVDNVIDEGLIGAEHLTSAFSLGCLCYSTPFYARYARELKAGVLIATSTYADSVRMERSRESWERQWADVLRHADGQVVLAVALICGGWELVRKIGPLFLGAAYHEHKKNHGVPV